MRDRNAPGNILPTEKSFPEPSCPVLVLPALALDEIIEVRTLLREYAAETEVDLCFQGFSEELGALPGFYAPPEGRLVMAKLRGQSAGCVAFRKADRHLCEMKRLFVRPTFRGRGIGRALANSAIISARAAGYSAMRLDTLRSMTGAVELYRSLGFRPIPAYYDNPLPNVAYFELQLS